MDRVRAPPPLLLDECPLEPAPALAAVLGVVEAADEAGVDRRSLDVLDHVVGEAAVAALGLLLERDQHVLGERAGAGLDVPGAVIELERGLVHARSLPLIDGGALQLDPHSNID